MSKEYFKYGVNKFYLDYIFMEYEYEPIVFTVKDSQETRYLCICIEYREEPKWFMTKVDFTTLINLIDEKIDLLKAFTKGKQLTTIEYVDGVDKFNCININEISKWELPESGVYLDTQSDDAKEHFRGIEFLQNHFSSSNTIAKKNKIKYKINTQEAKATNANCYVA